MPSLLKLWALTPFNGPGDFRLFVPFAPFSCGSGISIEKPSRLGTAYRCGCEVVGAAPARGGESPVEDGDILRVRILL